MKNTVFIFLLVLYAPLSAGCQSITGKEEEPDLPEADYVWRICNEDTDYAMKNIVIPNYNSNDLDSLVVGDVLPDKCSKYYIGTFGGDYPLFMANYEQSGEVYMHPYMQGTPVTRGLPDSLGTPHPKSAILPVLGRYTYHFFRDTTIHFTLWVELELEAYH